MDTKVRAAVYDRSRGVCDWCGAAIWPDTFDFHHRRLRSRGGTDTAANGVALHHECHMWVHNNPTQATADGFMVSAVHDPADIPVRVHRRRWCMPALEWTPVDLGDLDELHDPARTDH